ncbi:hypothetical protein SH1V18_01070 [Vallitalea longa]|uniref:Uncharacterized protein n=1 Tax=Vallitalea longa TaxID=2936439 RepID=A0A9W5Y7C0_9FIRM|nr:hypothetical protein [Vallitalea longa]GKX27627.1 hypothetical protein SH1V18_01070 [Vallitalea longa]
MRKAKKRSKLFPLMVVGLGISLTTPYITSYGNAIQPNTIIGTTVISELESDNLPVLTSIDNSNYSDLLSQYNQYLVAETTDAINDIESSLEDNEFYTALVRRTFIDRLGADNLEKFEAKSTDHADFLSTIFSRSDLLDLFLQGRVDYKQDRLVKSLDVWKNLWEHDEDCHDGFYAKFAIAMALVHANPIRTYDSNHTVIDPIVRYDHYKKLNTEGKLLPSFNNLDVTHLTMVADNATSDADIDWLHNFLRTKHPDYITQGSLKRAAFLMPYGKRDGRNYQGEWKLKDLLEIGGVCTRISYFGTLIYRSFGVPSTDVRQPNHMAFLYMSSENSWGLGNNIGGIGYAWNRPATTIPWGDHPIYTKLLVEAYKDEDNLVKSNQLLWLSEVMDSTDKMQIINKAIDVNENNLIAWYYKIDSMIAKNATIEEWKQIIDDILDTFTYHPKVMTDLLNRLPIKQISDYDRTILQEMILDIYAAFDKNTDSEQLSTIRALHKRLPQGNLVIAKYSVNGPNAGRLMGIKKGEEYSIDGGNTYLTATEDDLLLTEDQINYINTEDHIRIRINDTYEPYVLHIYKHYIKEIHVILNNEANTLEGMKGYMEFSTDKVNWTKYSNNLPDLSGYITIYIRRSGEGANLASNFLTRQFTAASFSFDGENANRLMGLKKGEKYSLDGGETFTTADEDDLLLTKDEVKSINSTDNIIIKPFDTDEEFVLHIKNSQLKDKYIKSSNSENTISGINKTMEFSIDKITWIRYNGENLPDLSGNVTIYVRKAATGLYLPSNIIARKFTAATFSFSGENANRLMGISTDYEYSLDGGETYTTPSEDNVLLTKEELDSITTTHGILVRKKNTDYILKIKIVKEGLLWSTIKSNDNLNTLTGIRSGMEFSIDNKQTWTRYNGSNLPNLTGNLTIHVRKYAKNNSLPSPAVTRTFTAATFSFSGENAGRLMGITPDVEYSLDGGKTYTTPSMEDVFLTDSELESINYNNNILLRTKGDEKAYTININKSTLKSNSLVSNDTNNTIKLYSSYEYSFDKVNWIRYNGNNDPDLSGNVTVYVRRAAAGTTAASNIISVKYTIGRFSFDGTNAGRLMGVTTDTEYSLDGGENFTTAKEKNVLLTENELESITTTHGILLRMIDTDDTQLIKIGKNGLWNSTIKADNTNNTLKGLSKYMEFSIDNKQTWTKYTGSNLPDLTGNVTIHVRKYARGTSLPSPIVTRKFTGNTPSIDLSHITFSFDGENAGRLMGITTDAEYSLDGGDSYTAPSEDDVLLADYELDSINSKDDILIRTKATDEVYTIDINSGELDSSSLDANDTDNTISLDTSLEYSYDGDSWTKYDGSNNPDLTGDVTIYVRKLATGTTTSSDMVEIQYTENIITPDIPDELDTVTFSFDGSKAGRLMGITTYAEYSFDGGDSYTTPSEDDVLLTKDELESMTSTDGILIRLKGTDKTQLIKLDQRTIHPRNVKSNDTNNTVTINKNMEFSIDNKNTWTRYNGNNLPDLTGNITIHLRKYATGRSLPSKTVTKKFTAN